METKVTLSEAVGLTGVSETQFHCGEGNILVFWLGSWAT